ncbi:MAG TPA: maleylpyruvate isomerase family mycothiol-dependent enzyme [Actinocrinis sp.]|uniref:maleylpyruvate isomerase family mycothiol-dependent enzyme n=1 Tax=Actinocrinis sp. TaxID=1920516 RepID=UPI002DDCFE55|nr:maleylpyruvate isomerase family mycothiol-dependent enzyme [Actinocrinis sp.]HEV2345303.1 maleylpyruvate isomerase family mycothiol-dependent enzyme [Actinocrinis sp.]
MGNHSRQNEELAAMWRRAPSDVAYRATRENISGLIEARPELADQVVPACPEWKVRDLLAHVVGNCRSEHPVLADDPQSVRPVDELDISELIDEWSQTGPEVEQLLGERNGLNERMMVMDVFTHELDLRRVVEETAPEDHPAFPTAISVLLGGFSVSVNARGLPALRVETEGADWLIGTGDEAATVRANRFDLYRSMAGRRTHQQIAGLSWSAPADTWLPAFTWGPFHPPTQATEDMIGTDDAYEGSLV